MLARASAAILGVELLIYLLLGCTLVRACGWSLGSAVALVILIALALRWAVVLVTFLSAWFWRMPRMPQERIGAYATVRLVWREAMAMFWVFNVLQPLEAWLMPADRLDHGTRTVVLVHGYCCNRAAWWWLARRLRERGWNVATANLEPVLGDIEELADRIAWRVEQVCVQFGVERVAIVTHSMGGLVARAYVRRAGARRVAQLITLGAPHGGARIATLGLGRNARQMEVGNLWLQTLASTALPAALPVTCIYSVHDNFVAPQSNQSLEGGRNVPVKGIGHLELLHDDEVATLVLSALDKS